MAIATAARLGVRTAVLLHKGFLVEQWRARLATFAPGARVGVVAQDVNAMVPGSRGGGACDGRDPPHEPPDVVLVMIQTVLRRHAPPTTTFDTVGLVVVDECHHVCARSFMRALLSFPARWRLGLTATPTRRDGLGHVLPWLLGPLAAEVARAAPDVEVVWIDGAPDLAPVRDKRGKKGKVAYAPTVTALVEDAVRNGRLVRYLRAAVAAGRQAIVFSERREHLRELAGHFPDTGALYLGETTKRGKAARDARAATANPLFATYAMGEEGLDIPRLDLVLFASPRGSPACIEQCVGRVLRAFPGKPTRRVVDVGDGFFKTLARERARFYRGLGGGQ